MPLPPPIPPSYPPAPLREDDPLYVSRWSNDPLGLQVMRLGEKADADGNIVTTTMYEVRDPLNVIFAARDATRVDLGAYQIELQSVDTQTPSFYEVRWDYSIDAIPLYYLTYIEVGEVAPDYDALDSGMKQEVERVWLRFADLFDSVEGGPNLLDYYQSKFGRNRIAQLLRIAVNSIASWMQPTQFFTTEGNGRFPTEQWPGLLEKALYVEVIKHLMRSYTEQPSPEGVGHARLDRRDYVERWRTILDMEVAGPGGLNNYIEQMKFAAMSRPQVLVEGGAYGRWGYSSRTLPLSAAARPYYWRTALN